MKINKKLIGYSGAALIALTTNFPVLKNTSNLPKKVDSIEGKVLDSEYISGEFKLLEDAPNKTGIIFRGVIPNNPDSLDFLYSSQGFNAKELKENVKESISLSPYNERGIKLGSPKKVEVNGNEYTVIPAFYAKASFK